MFFNEKLTDLLKVIREKETCIDTDAGILVNKFHVVNKVFEKSRLVVSMFFNEVRLKVKAENEESRRDLRTKDNV